MGLHTALFAFMAWGATQIDIPAAPLVYRVQLVAAPQEAPVRTVPVPERRPAPEPEAEVETAPVETAPEPEPVPRRETPPPEEAEAEETTEPESQPEAEERPAAPPEQSVEGSDVPVRLEGAPFPYPEYLANIIVQIKRHWRPPSEGRQLRAELAFTILSDGTVESVQWIRRSGDPGFDLEARGAIETAGRRGAFGPLPDDYPADRLRVSFFFDPTRY